MRKREGYFVQDLCCCENEEERKMPRIVDGGDVVAIARQELPDDVVRAIDEGVAVDSILVNLDSALHTLARRYHSLRVHPPQDLAGQRVCIG